MQLKTALCNAHSAQNRSKNFLTPRTRTGGRRSWEGGGVLDRLLDTGKILTNPSLNIGGKGKRVR